MAIEIERKYLLANDEWRGLTQGTSYRQGYVCNQKDKTVRIRTDGVKGILTIKGEGNGLARAEYEYRIPLDDANEILDTMCDDPPIEKTRYCIEYQGFIWEVDEFHGANNGLLIAEVELESEDQHAPIPHWIGEEVTGELRYYNAYLVQHPYSTWK